MPMVAPSRSPTCIRLRSAQPPFADQLGQRPQPLDQVQGQGEDAFGDGPGAAAGRDHDGDPAGAGRLQVDQVDPDAGAGDDPQPRGAVEERRVHHRVGAGDGADGHGQVGRARVGHERHAVAEDPGDQGRVHLAEGDHHGPVSGHRPASSSCACGGGEGGGGRLADGEPPELLGEDLDPPGPGPAGGAERPDAALEVEGALPAQPPAVGGVLEQGAHLVGVGVAELDADDVTQRDRGELGRRRPGPLGVPHVDDEAAGVVAGVLAPAAGRRGPSGCSTREGTPARPWSRPGGRPRPARRTPPPSGRGPRVRR